MYPKDIFRYMKTPKYAVLILMLLAIMVLVKIEVSG